MSGICQPSYLLGHGCSRRSAAPLWVNQMAAVPGAGPPEVKRSGASNYELCEPHMAVGEKLEHIGQHSHIGNTNELTTT